MTLISDWAIYIYYKDRGTGILDKSELNTELVEELKKFIIETLELEDITPDDIETEEALFIDGLGLDSIDALELGMALKKKYNLKMSQDKEENKKYFYSVKTLADFIESQK